MSDVTLENVDLVRERANVSYAEAKEALEACNGDVLEAIIYIENKENSYTESNNETIDDLKKWLKNLIEKGNVSRIRIKKDEKVLVDVPVNAGVATAVIAVVIPQLLAFGIIAAVATKITIEITKIDGTVEVVNKYVSQATSTLKEKVSTLSGKLKGKFSDVKHKEKVYSGDDTIYSYTVNFDEEDK